MIATDQNRVANPCSVPGAVTSLALLAAALLAGAPGTPARAQENQFVIDATQGPPRSVRDPEMWQEQRADLPPWPNEADLMPVRLDSPNETFQFFIDTRSLNTGADGVVRYTLVAESPSGVRNLSFEGLRCTPRGQYRIYAFGHQGQFEPAGLGEDWRPIDRTGSDAVREELWRHYLCVARKFTPRPREAQIRALARGRVGEHENSGFMPH